MKNAPTADLPTKDQALAVRPRLDDPTRLTNGDFHPSYVEWITRYAYADQHPFSDFLHGKERLDRVVDDHGYFDRTKVKRALGSSGTKMWLVDGPLPTTARIPLLAQLLGVTIDDMTAVVGREREMRGKHEAMLAACRALPYRLLTYEQTVAGLPCPGCGRPWIGRQEDFDTDRSWWDEAHRDCHAGRHSLGGGPLHCVRCCGFPAINPERLAEIRRMILDAQERAQASQSPEARTEQAMKDALRRAKRIKALEAELARLRAADSMADSE